MMLSDFYRDLAFLAPDYKWTINEKGHILGEKRGIRRPVLRSPAVVHYERFYDTGICQIQRSLMLAEQNEPNHDPEIRKSLTRILGLDKENVCGV